MIDADNFENTSFLTGGQGSCLVVYVLNKDANGKPIAAAMAHILSANLNSAKMVKNPNGTTRREYSPVSKDTCRERLGGFWSNHLHDARKDNVFIFTGQEPIETTKEAVKAVQAAISDNPGLPREVVKLNTSHYGVAPANGSIIENNIPAWMFVRTRLIQLAGTEKPLVTAIMDKGVSGNTLVENADFDSNMRSLEL
ncbi:hypothetical protein PSE_0144 [Pseudovibrio sp. FO-BEG1]|nr:hypothetical protein PSE_0144 [Pseudovibrio sp. FO-BEG1]